MAAPPLRLARAARALPLSLLLGAGAPGAHPNADIEIAVQDVRSSEGRILVTICPRAAYPGPCKLSGEAPAHAGTTWITIREVPPGSYAALAFHDLNGNGRLDKWMGMPREGYGFSRMPRRAMGQPSFDNIRFEHDASPQRMALVIHYLW